MLDFLVTPWLSPTYIVYMVTDGFKRSARKGASKKGQEK